jgi:hypothetical protein
MYIKSNFLKNQFLSKSSYFWWEINLVQELGGIFLHSFLHSENWTIQLKVKSLK